MDGNEHRVERDLLPLQRERKIVAIHLGRMALAVGIAPAIPL